MSADDKKFVPSKYHPRSANYVELIQQRLGKSDFDLNFDNEFQEFKLTMKFVAETMEAINQGLIPLKKYNKVDLIPNEKAVERLDLIWNGGCKYAVTYNENRTRVLQKVFCYDTKFTEINRMRVDKYIPIPRLKNMVPVRELREDTWGVQIRENYPLRFAWEGASYATVVNDARFSFYLVDGVVPKITAKDMYSETKKTYILHRPVYHTLMNDLTMFFRKNENIFLTNMQKILQWMEEEYDEGLGEYSELLKTLKKSEAESRITEEEQNYPEPTLP